MRTQTLGRGKSLTEWEGGILTVFAQLTNELRLPVTSQRARVPQSLKSDTGTRTGANKNGQIEGGLPQCPKRIRKSEYGERDLIPVWSRLRANWPKRESEEKKAVHDSARPEFSPPGESA